LPLFILLPIWNKPLALLYKNFPAAITANISESRKTMAISYVLVEINSRKVANLLERPRFFRLNEDKILTKN